MTFETPASTLIINVECCGLVDRKEVCVFFSQHAAGIHSLSTAKSTFALVSYSYFGMVASSPSMVSQSSEIWQPPLQYHQPEQEDLCNLTTPSRTALQIKCMAHSWWWQ